MEGEGLASSTALLNASAQMERKITRRDAQTFIKALVKDKWLSEVVSGTVSGLFHISITAVSTWQSQGVYGAGPRFILELRPFLSEVFGEEVVHCHVCKEPVIRVSDLHSNTLNIRLTHCLHTCPGSVVWQWPLSGQTASVLHCKACKSKVSYSPNMSVVGLSLRLCMSVIGSGFKLTSF